MLLLMMRKVNCYQCKVEETLLVFYDTGTQLRGCVPTWRGMAVVF